MMPRLRVLAGLPLVLLFVTMPVAAEVTRIHVTSRTPFGENVPGKIGPYERLRGRVVYALDPTLDASRRVVDLELAISNQNGLVELYADFEILVPVDRDQAQPTVLYNLNNRGRRTWGAEPFLLSRGYVTVSSGWIAETPPGPTLLRLEAPVAYGEDGVNVVGVVRVELSTDVPTDRLPVSNQLSYEPVTTLLPDATLTRRVREADTRVPIPRDQWRLRVTSPAGEEGSGLVESDVSLDGGFEPGAIYELIYTARGSIVQGTGFAAIRDLVSFLKHDTSEMNPLLGSDRMPIAERVIGEGRSQSGRALRMFIYQGFNADEQGRQVFDGVMPQIAGGGHGFFNQRFASPTQTSTQHNGHLYPVDRFPFTYGPETDPFTGRRDSLLREARESGTVPRIMHPDTTSEYWHRSGSLVVTDPTGERDSDVPSEVRVYLYGGSQHGPAHGPSDRGQQQPNPTDYRPLSETLFLAMDRWITDGTPPPPSVYPRVADGTLVKWQEHLVGWASIPGVRYPTVIQQPEYLDYGLAFFDEGRIDHHPPKQTGKRYGVRVPALDADNNERGVLRLPSIEVPVGTYMGWNLRNPEIGAQDELLRLTRWLHPVRPNGRRAQRGPRPQTEPRRAVSGLRRLSCTLHGLSGTAGAEGVPVGRAPGDGEGRGPGTPCGVRRDQ